jgi:aldehyde:ferredoxin oxidoreductase
VQQNLACALNSMVLCIFSSYGMIPAAVHNLSPNGLPYKIASKVFENLGPTFRLAMGMKGKPMLFWEKWLTYITGTPLSGGHVQEIGARIFNLERMYNLREGLTPELDTLPPRILNEPTFPGMTSGHPLGKLLPRYYKLRGWDKGGIPAQKTLDSLQVRT